jgi:hypothetical protein
MNLCLLMAVGGSQDQVEHPTISTNMQRGCSTATPEKVPVSFRFKRCLTDMDPKFKNPAEPDRGRRKGGEGKTPTHQGRRGPVPGKEGQNSLEDLSTPAREGHPCAPRRRTPGSKTHIR